MKTVKVNQSTEQLFAISLVLFLLGCAVFYRVEVLARCAGIRLRYKLQLAEIFCSREQLYHMLPNNKVAFQTKATHQVAFY